MKNNLKKAISAVVISSLALSFGSGSIFADEAAPAAIDTRYPVALDGPLQVKVNGLLSEHTLNGTRIGVKLKMYNVSNDTVRVPDYELRAVTQNGAKYVLKGSADNAVAVPPMSSIDLSFMTQIDLGENVQPTDLVWIDVNKDVYPKTETTMLDLPVANLVWYGDHSSIADPSAVKNWGETFQIPSLDSALTYTPVNLSTNFKDQTPVQFIKLLVQNPGSKSETVPSFSLDGKSATLTYKGSRVDQAVTSLDPGDKKYIYYAVPTDLDTQLSSFTVSTTEAYKVPNRTDAAANVTFNIGRLSILTPEADQAGQDTTQPVAYTMNTPLPVDPINNSINPDISVSVVDMQTYENEGMGYQTGIVKLKFSNRSDKPLPVPQFAAELVGGGFTYAGSRLNSDASLVVPGTDYVVNYSFVLPLNGAKAQYTLKLIDDKTAAPYKVTLSQAVTYMNNPVNDNETLKAYPYQVTIRDWALSNLAGMNQATQTYNYSYKLRINWDLKSTDSVMVDSAYNKLLMVLETKDGRKIASTTKSLSGDNRLTSGEQLIYFSDTSSDQLENNLTLKMYETIDTPAGQARRLIATLQQ
ncbi:hypothetical protein SK3146_01683 [Paenibacillus konkukensis]|uniref:Uncharacterized protein n=1 Tax=Paenibacillus konkukensis TaxID=2020716 RepID=A0ABY4RKY4_9BACL|nr:hypothetical protein [Paenibacillus konkukensis]UQZ82526.1 hypothetical protein SK3146_01683 [Paenibacillus konkukensis]